mmetsp:Transcript_7765/g.7235  ORF Transcript_7765/g.7235 Transcript_7765/m.7235 type:complete len:99 (+) Transcript_7765:104-400(+)
MKRDECQAKLNRAQILMNSLGNEKSRWESTSDRLLVEKESLLGDMILASAFITYMGPFEGVYREKVVQREWTPIISAYEIIVGEKFNLPETIGSKSDI